MSRDTLTTDSLSMPLTRMAPRILTLSGLAMRQAVLSRLSSLQDRVVIEERGERFAIGHGAQAVTLRVHDTALWGRIALRGALGAGESYAFGEWSSPDLPELLRLLLRNRDSLTALNGGLSRLHAPLRSGMQALRRNTREGSKRNIAAHYDLSNAFFALLLDETMTYSAGLFEGQPRTMREASEAKLTRLCEALQLSERDHLLEIGTGWGSLAIHAASNYGCRVTTTTISDAQYEVASRKVREAGLAERVTVLQRDYRDLSGHYDKLVSVEMIEAVGHQYYDAYFRKCASLLRPGGLFAMQAIVIGERDYRRARDSVDFIKAHVFPGCCIPSTAALLQAASPAGFRVDQLRAYASDYACTLRHWRDNLHERRAEIAASGLSQRQFRAFDYYLAYCEAGFLERHIDLQQLVLSRER